MLIPQVFLLFYLLFHLLLLCSFINSFVYSSFSSSFPLLSTLPSFTFSLPFLPSFIFFFVSFLLSFSPFFPHSLFPHNNYLIHRIIWIPSLLHPSVSLPLPLPQPSFLPEIKAGPWLIRDICIESMLNDGADDSLSHSGMIMMLLFFKGEQSHY